jgi:antitoxin component YwqK of YwqJK toxin-antitoxin module
MPNSLSMHIKEIVTCFLLIIFFECSAQRDTSYFDKSWKPCPAQKAEYYRIIKPQEKGFLVTDYYMNHVPQMVGNCSRVDSLVNDGPCAYYDRQGRVINQGIYTNNVKTGAWTFTEYFNNGAKYSSGITKSGLLDSVITFYYRTGAVYTTATLMRDTLNGTKTFFRENGSISSTESYLKGELNGWYIQYRENGLKIYEEEYKNGKSTGNKRLYFKSGQLQGDFSWTERGVNGYKIWYYENGEIQSQVTFENGKRKKMVRSGQVVQ